MSFLELTHPQQLKFLDFYYRKTSTQFVLQCLFNSFKRNSVILGVIIVQISKSTRY